MKQLIRNYKPDPLQELIQMCRDVRIDAETALYRQSRFFKELDAWGFFEQPGFESLLLDIEDLNRIRMRYDDLMDRISKQLRELNAAMIEAEKKLPPSDANVSEKAASFSPDIEQILAMTEREASNSDKE